MAEGWIKLYRDIRKHWIWEDALKLKWWLDILLQANHQERKILLGNEIIMVERGSFHTSELKLSRKWSVSKTTVRKFLELLESDLMITTEKSKKGTTIKVSNYDDYQGFLEEEKTDKKPQKNHNVDHKETIKEPYAIPQKNHEVYTNNNDKELNNEKNDKECKEREERYKNTISKDIVSSTKVQPIIDKWNSLGLQKIVSINTGTNRYKLLNARIKEYGEEAILSAIDEIQLSTFLKGQNKKSWIITFDWFIKPNNFIKVLEGNYRDKSDNTKKHSSFGESMRKLYKEAVIEDEQEGINADNDYTW